MGRNIIKAKGYIKPVVLALLAAATIGMAGSVAAEPTITVASWGGEYQKAQRKALFDPTEKALGINIKGVTLSSLGDIRVQVRSGAVTWDIVDLGAKSCALGAKQGLFEPLDYSVINAEGINPRMVADSWIGVVYFSTVLSWNTGTVDNPPRTWAEFWNVAKYPGLRSMYNNPGTMLEAALLADGVKPESLYPLDVDRAFESLKEIKPDVNVWWTSGAQGIQVLVDGAVDMGPTWDGRLREAMESGAHVDFHYNQGILSADCLAIPKGAPHKELAMKAIAKFVSPELQANIPEYISYGPINTKAFEVADFSEEQLSQISTSPENIEKQVILNAQWWGEHGAEVQERWTSFIQR